MLFLIKHCDNKPELLCNPAKKPHDHTTRHDQTINHESERNSHHKLLDIGTQLCNIGLLANILKKIAGFYCKWKFTETGSMYATCQ